MPPNKARASLCELSRSSNSGIITIRYKVRIETVSARLSRRDGTIVGHMIGRHILVFVFRSTSFCEAPLFDDKANLDTPISGQYVLWWQSDEFVNLSQVA